MASDIIDRLHVALAEHDDIGWHDVVIEAMNEIEILRRRCEHLCGLASEQRNEIERLAWERRDG